MLSMPIYEKTSVIEFLSTTIYKQLKFIVMLNATLIGNLGADAEVKVLNGKEYLTFRVAHTEKFTKQDGSMVEETTWCSCISSSFAKLQPYLKKGSKVFVSGELKLRVIYRPQTKENIVGVNINCRHIELCGTKPVETTMPTLFTNEGIEVKTSMVMIPNTPIHVGTELIDSQLTKYVVSDQGIIERKAEIDN